MHASMFEKLRWTLLLVTLSACGFLYIDARNASLVDTSRSLHLETWLDRRIPFVPEFIFAYLLYYPFVFLPLFALRTRVAFYRALCSFAALQVLAQIVFVVFPSHMKRPQVVSTGVAAALVRWMYRVDVGWNVFPSLHVGHAVLVALFFLRYERRSLALAVSLGTLLISASTVLVKQHYAVDVPAGMLLAGFCYWAAGLPFHAGERALRSGDLERHRRSAHRDHA